MDSIDRIDYDALVRLGAERLRALHAERPFNSEEAQALKEAARRFGRCGFPDHRNGGLPCLRIPKLGFTVCGWHGARAPQTIASAHRRIATALTPALEWINLECQRMLEPTCPACGYPSQSLKERRHYVTMLRNLLDRFGLGPGKTLTVKTEGGLGTELMALVAEASPTEREELRRYMDGIKAWKERVGARLGKVVEVQDDRGNGDPGQGVDRGAGALRLPEGLQRRDGDGEPR